jgi:hypothetical protein
MTEPLDPEKTPPPSGSEGKEAFEPASPSAEAASGSGGEESRVAEAPTSPAAPVASAPTAPAPAAAPSPSRPALVAARDPLFRECRGYRLRLDPPDLARLRELPGARGKSDEELGEQFFDGQAERLAESIAGDVPAPSEIRVVVDPYSRQAFLALENRIRGILSF